MVWLGPLRKQSIEEIDNYKHKEYQWQLNKQGHLVYSNDKSDQLVDSSLLKPYYKSKAFSNAVKQYGEFFNKAKSDIENFDPEWNGLNKPVPIEYVGETKQKWWIRFLKWLMQ